MSTKGKKPHSRKPRACDADENDVASDATSASTTSTTDAGPFADPHRRARRVAECMDLHGNNRCIALLSGSGMGFGMNVLPFLRASLDGPALCAVSFMVKITAERHGIVARTPWVHRGGRERERVSE
jgi:hypothetical protein